MKKLFNQSVEIVFALTLLLTGVFLLLSTSSFAQGPLEWARSNGTSLHDSVAKVTVDYQGNTFVVMNGTLGSDFQTVDPGGPAYYQAAANGPRELGIMKYDVNGNLVWSTMFGGSGSDFVTDVATDGYTSLYIVGYTTSTDFPTLDPGANTYFQANHAGGTMDGFILRFDLDDGQLLWSTYYGGSGDDHLIGATTSGAYSRIYAVGKTTSTDFPTMNPGGGAYYQATLNGTSDGVIIQFDHGNQRHWSTYIGGLYEDEIVAVSNNPENGNVVMVGNSTDSLNFPTHNPGGGTYHVDHGMSTEDAVINEFTFGGVMTWGTYYGGTDIDKAVDVVIDSAQAVYVLGSTKSRDLPTMDQGNGAYFQADLGTNISTNPNTDAFILKFENKVRTWATFFGGPDDELIGGITVNGPGDVYVVGTTWSFNMPVMDPGGNNYYDNFASIIPIDGFSLWFDSDNKLVSSGYIGNDAPNYLFDVACSWQNDIVIVGKHDWKMFFDNDTLDEGGMMTLYFDQGTVVNIQADFVSMIANYECEKQLFVDQTTVSPITNRVDKVVWHYGDGNIDTISSGSKSTLHTYASPGTYYVKMVAYDDLGNVDSVAKWVEIFQAPNLDFHVTNACKGTPTQFINTSTADPNDPFTNFFWNFNDTSTATHPVATYPNAGSYWVSLWITTEHGCEDSVSRIIFIEDNCDSVWPGDANADHTANVFDLLPIGLKYGKTGPSRPINPDNAWMQRPCNPWSESFLSGLNIKHADCNGDGTINMSDTTAIMLNYGKTHNKKGFEGPMAGPNDPDFYLDAPVDTTFEGTALDIPIKFGTMQNWADSTYGIVFTINFDPTLIDSGNIKVDFSTSWLGTLNTDMIAIQHLDFAGGQLDVAVTRIDHQDYQGQGTLGTLKIVTIDNLSGKTWLRETLNLTISDLMVIDNDEDIKPVNIGHEQVVISDIRDRVDPLELDYQVYPNPTKDVLNIQIMDIDGLEGFQIVDLLGHQLLFLENDFKVNVNHLQPGVYFVVPKVKDQLLFSASKRFVIRR